MLPSARWLSLTVGMGACCLVTTGCGRHSAEGGAGWPDITPGCEHVALIGAQQPAPPHYVVRELHGSWDEPDKNLRHWLINKACAAGANAVVNVIETEGLGEDGPVWNISGVAVVLHPR